ncbi:MAG: DNA starvation/stationary phase protection protein [Alphaproteobacteria bacterium]|nr:DNA starvation/stationary phase protection protein [Alphaproteobacteria bacterium]
MEIQLGLDKTKRRNTADHLEVVLADTFILYIKTLNFHWNIVGPDFAGLHAFFEEQYKTLALSVDKIAERIRTLGFKAPGTLVEFLHLATLHEVKEDMNEAEMIQNLLDDHERLASHIRKDLHGLDELDVGSRGLLEGLIASHEKTAWMLRSHLL